MSRRGEIDAIVVGAGVAGASLALALARDGFEVAVVESHVPKAWQSTDEVDARVVALAADAMALFDDLGVWSDILGARASGYRRMCVWDALAPGQLIFDAADDGKADLGWIVENRLLQHVLWQALASANADVSAPRVFAQAAIESLDQDAQGVSVALDDGTRLRARLLVAADGAQSALRVRLGIATLHHDYDQRAIVAHVTTERAHEHTAWQRFQPGGPLALLPLSDGRSSIVWSRPSADAERLLALDDAEFLAELGCATDFRLGAIIASTPRRAIPLQLRLAERYVEGRCVLLGDAAHSVHPLAGQGLNLGLRDVANLREQCSAARSRAGDIGAAHLLRRYERERRSENTMAARALDLIERIYGSDRMAVAAARGLALGLADRVAPLKHLLSAGAAGRL